MEQAYDFLKQNKDLAFATVGSDNNLPQNKGISANKNRRRVS